MLSTTHTTTSLTQHTNAVISYAASNPSFACALRATIAYYFDVPESTPTTQAPRPLVSQWLIPTDQTQAEKHTAWLLREITYAPVQEKQSVVETLTTWAAHHEEPRNLALGVIGVAIIGPTLGIIKHKKRKKRKMQLVLESSTSTSTPHLLSGIVTEASTALIARELETKNGNAYRLHPDTAEWLFTDQQTSLTRLPVMELIEIERWLISERLPHFTLKKDMQIVAIALSPSISEELVLGEQF